MVITVVTVGVHGQNLLKMNCASALRSGNAAVTPAHAIGVNVGRGDGVPSVFHFRLIAVSVPSLAISATACATFAYSWQQVAAVLTPIAKPDELV